MLFSFCCNRNNQDDISLLFIYIICGIVKQIWLFISLGPEEDPVVGWNMLYKYQTIKQSLKCLSYWWVW